MLRAILVSVQALRTTWASSGCFFFLFYFIRDTKGFGRRLEGNHRFSVCLQSLGGVLFRDEDVIVVLAIARVSSGMWW